MSKLLEIVITHWTEPWDVGEKAFWMLSLQRRVDWNDIVVTLIHDGSEAFPDEYFTSCPFTVAQVCLPHGGISAARNYAIKNSSAEWIKFCDFDDMFAGVMSLSCIMNVLDDKAHDLLWFPLIVDRYHKDIQVLNCSPVFIHDKVFRLSTLRDKDIYFNESLSFSEDYAFQCMIRLDVPRDRIGKIESNFPIYVYIQRPDSVANRSDMWFKNYCGHFDTLCSVERELRQRGQLHNADLMFARAMAEAYYVMITADVSENTEAFWQSVRTYYRSHASALRHISSTELDSTIDDTNAQHRTHITPGEFNRWIDHFMR